MSDTPSHFRSGAWSMADELTFIDHLGNWTNNNQRLTPQQKLSLLEGYRLGLARRTLWGNLNQQELEAYIQREIARLLSLPSDSTL
jgi:hypothetical protein